MKTSSGLLLGVLFTLVVVIVAVVIYFNTRPEEKSETSTGPSPTLPSIDEFTISRTDSPDSDSETYMIEPYTIEYLYVEGDNEKALSKNVKFTLNWKNGNGYNNVQKLEIEHYVVQSMTDAPLKKTFAITKGTEDATNKYPGMFENYGSASYSISGDGIYSFIGMNRFKIKATLDYKQGNDTENKQIILYDGVTTKDGSAIEDIPQLNVSEEELTATIGMTGSITKEFKLKLQDDSMTGEDEDGVSKEASSVVTNTKYNLKSYTDPANPTSLVKTISNVELIPQDAEGDKFKFRINGQYVKATMVTELKKTNNGVTIEPVLRRYAKYSVGAGDAATCSATTTPCTDAIITFVYNTDASDKSKRILKTKIGNFDYYLFGKALHNAPASGATPTASIIWKELTDVTEAYDDTKTWTISTCQNKACTVTSSL
jgi:hypothetical protein